jgi:hypothetical protein
MNSRKSFDYFLDLSSYEVEEGIVMPEVLNIGWLSKEIKFQEGNSSEDFIRKLKRIIEISTSTSLNLVMGRWRGISACPLCGIPSYNILMNWEQRERKRGIERAELWIPSICRQETYYSSSTYIAHYIMHHNYLPPDEYIESVLAVDESATINADKVAIQLERKAYLRQNHKKNDEYVQYLNIMEKLIDK